MLNAQTVFQAPIVNAWSSSDDRFPFAHVSDNIGTLSNALAQQIAHLEIAQQLLRTTDWSSSKAMSLSMERWPGRTTDRAGVEVQRVLHWHGEEVLEIKRGIARCARKGPVTPEIAKSSLEWRVRYLRKEFLAMASAAGFGAEASAMLDHIRLTFGATGKRSAKWYAFNAIRTAANPAATAGG
jgi:hypothetical protein